eukprot:6465585-Amphidinium_carterae.1
MEWWWRLPRGCSGVTGGDSLALTRGSGRICCGNELRTAGWEDVTGDDSRQARSAQCNCLFDIFNVFLWAMVMMVKVVEVVSWMVKLNSMAQWMEEQAQRVANPSKRQRKQV